MTKAEFLRLFEPIVQVTPGTLRGDEHLRQQVQHWDSLAAATFMALADEQFGIIVSPKELAKAQTVADLIRLLGDHIETPEDVSR